MSAFSFLTIQKESSGLYKEKGSKFIALAYPVSSEAEIKTHLSSVQKEFYDARHHCYAWILGPEKKSFRAFDDGEPNHSAGDPILGQIRSRNLTDVLVIVVRYFGGTKLGVGGLVSAYKAAADAALTQAAIIEKEIQFDLSLLLDYDATPEVMRLIKEFRLDVLSQNFASVSCEMHLRGAIRIQPKLMEKIKLLQDTGTNVQFSDDKQA